MHFFDWVIIASPYHKLKQSLFGEAQASKHERGSMIRKFLRYKRLIIPAIVLVTIVISILAVRNWATVGTSLANPMRKLIGVRGVAQLETMLFNAQDGIKKWKYSLGLAEPELPWEVSPERASIPETDPAASFYAQSTESLHLETATLAATDASPLPLDTSSVPATQAPTPTIVSDTDTILLDAYQPRSIW
jgi:hypothetical protein